MRTLSHAQQLPLDPDLEEELVQQKAKQIYSQSRFLSARYASFARLMEDPVAGRCLRLCATQCLRLGSKTRSR
jgi:hypothetical protein